MNFNDERKKSGGEPKNIHGINEKIFVFVKRWEGILRPLLVLQNICGLIFLYKSP